MAESEYMRQLKRDVKTLGAKANKRLSILEESNVQKSSKAYQYLSSKSANRSDLIQKNGTMRFDVSLDRKQQELESTRSMLKGFLSAKTSTVSGTERTYKRAYKTFIHNIEFDDFGNRKLRQSKNGYHRISYDEWKSIVENAYFDEFKEKFGSEQVQIILGKYDYETTLQMLSEWIDLNSVREINEKARKVYNEYKDKQR